MQAPCCYWPILTFQSFVIGFLHYVILFYSSQKAKSWLVADHFEHRVLSEFLISIEATLKEIRADILSKWIVSASRLVVTSWTSSNTFQCYSSQKHLSVPRSVTIRVRQEDGRHFAFHNYIVSNEKERRRRKQSSTPPKKLLSVFFACLCFVSVVSFVPTPRGVYIDSVFVFQPECVLYLVLSIRDCRKKKKKLPQFSTLPSRAWYNHPQKSKKQTHRCVVFFFFLLRKQLCFQNPPPLWTINN